MLNRNLELPPHSPLQKINLPALEEAEIQCYIKRDDLLDSEFQGNKYRKLKYNLQYAIDQGYEEIVSFGGAYSNHLHALSFIPELSSLKVTVYVRGEINDPENKTLHQARLKGIRLISLPRNEYRRRSEVEFQRHIMQTHPNGYLVPEGGTNELAVKGVIECGNEIREQLGEEPDYCLVPVGSGGTLSGLVQCFSSHCQVIGVAAFRGSESIDQIRQVVLSLSGSTPSNWEILSHFHFGGFAKMTHSLFDFICDFQTETGILLDPIYTSKMVFAFTSLVVQGFFEKGSKVVLIHTGGVQGWDGFIQRFSAKYPFEKLSI